MSDDYFKKGSYRYFSLTSSTTPPQSQEKKRDVEKYSNQTTRYHKSDMKIEILEYDIKD